MAVNSARKAIAPVAGRKPADDGKPTRQSLKSAQTRSRLIEATIQCLVKVGYSGTTTPLVASEAGLSRGAMLHHFENSATLIRATIVELHERRLRAFRRSSENSQHDPSTMVSAYWRQVQKPAFIAFQELAMAARTNSELAQIMRPLQIEYRERFNAEAIALYPEWHSAPENFAQAMALSQTLMEGMAMSLLTGALDEAMVPSLLHMLEDKIRTMRPGAGTASAA
ncbi:TetR/AcrR family transcriptional regulator [Novosphingobium sp. PY1]|uniref:TetR/AcrR family transcriptional regulator n=1 Tax=Novosphingobium sp. PY1 TaxID=1882221 RepID=UPI000BE77E49|nr:TetR/AcrR family transcriptional regulator [Novosphingobium sp. PY1]BBA74125.1 TetR family transcriptional regulator [Novosphingobium sp. PY1]GFM31362.1 TetR family transcriptional regulator [Novosphingobium sp. PY1]